MKKTSKTGFASFLLFMAISCTKENLNSPSNLAAPSQLPTLSLNPNVTYQTSPSVDSLYYTVYRDVDGDTWGNGSVSRTIPSSQPPPPGSVTRKGDCNDNNNAIHPGAPEVVNGVDDNCDGDTK